MGVMIPIGSSLEMMFGWPCVELGVELDDLHGSLPTQYDSMEKLQYRLNLLEKLLAASN